MAHYLIRYADGKDVEVPVVYGQEVRDTVFNRSSPTFATNATTAWETPCDTCGDERTRLRLFHFTWVNPRPETPLRELDFVSALSGSAPFLVALTTE